MSRPRDAGKEAGAGAIARRAQQARARQKCHMIIDAASRVISAEGIAGLTHRLVAKKARVSLAATTYHFESKADIIRAASKATLKSYDLAFAKASDRFRVQGGSVPIFLEYFTALMRNTAGRARVRAICWGEIMLDVPRNPENLEDAQKWFMRTRDVWADMITACGMERAQQRAVVSIDILIGLLFLIVGLGLTDGQIGKVIAEGKDLLDFRPASTAAAQTRMPARDSAKAAATRTKILAATIDMLKSEGPGAVNSRTVAERAGLTKAAPFYYFSCVADLLAAAQHKLFARSKDRYRQGLSEVGGADADFEHLIDRTSAVFLREATEFSGESIANYSLWLRAESEPAVRAMIWEAAADQHQSWRVVLRRWKPDLAPIDPLLGQALFIGKLVRVLATGSHIRDLAGIRREFAVGLREIAAGSGLASTKQYNPSKQFDSR